MSDYAEDTVEIEAQIKRIAVRLREEREKIRISQIDLSFLAGLSQNQVFCIETGRRIPNLYTLFKICSALNINPAVLFETPDEERRQARDTIINLVSKYI
ncbi:MAG: helix-turn-helix domain-containing protein [Treponema sp.]|jgi:transcriptional regulator with XRE-family HTH domain|nr:helix-turn-helix domain-containing protein [Treponema sp.]